GLHVPRGGTGGTVVRAALPSGAHRDPRRADHRVRGADRAGIAVHAAQLLHSAAALDRGRGTERWAFADGGVLAHRAAVRTSRGRGHGDVYVQDCVDRVPVRPAVPGAGTVVVGGTAGDRAADRVRHAGDEPAGRVGSGDVPGGGAVHIRPAP